MISDQIQKNRALFHDNVPFFKGVFQGINPFVYSIFKVAAELVSLLFPFVVEFDGKIVKFLFHVPRDVFGQDFLDVFDVEEIE